ncbi:SH3 domain-containing protein [Streptomyces sp. NPDC088794]|uniref:SH3 domain-containing protein n=1 Tax=Streptomyces sp. NPDC088794 TaxID=3365902 RepID=UPI0037F89380
MGSIRVRLFTLLLVGASLLTLVGAAGCEKSNPSVSFTPEFVPVTFTLDASGKISISVGRSFVTPIGAFSVDTGVEHQFAVSPKGYLTAVIRYVDQKLGLAEAGYVIHTEHKVEPAMDGITLAPAKGILRTDFTGQQTGGTLTISDTPQDTQVPTSSAPSCPQSESVPVTLPEVSAGDSVADTAAELSAVCLTVQYATEPADQDDGTVSRVLIPLASEGSVQLPPAADGDPGPGDKVTASTRQAATVYVAGPDVEPSPTVTDGSPSPTVSPDESPDAPPSTGTTTVHADANAPVRSTPSITGTQLSSVMAGTDYPALCVQQAEQVTAHGRTSSVWIQLSLADGGTGWVTGTAFGDAPETLVPATC